MRRVRRALRLGCGCLLRMRVFPTRPSHSRVGLHMAARKRIASEPAMDASFRSQLLTARAARLPAIIFVQPNPTKIVYGSGIDHAVTETGKPYRNCKMHSDIGPKW